MVYVGSAMHVHCLQQAPFVGKHGCGRSSVCWMNNLRMRKTKIIINNKPGKHTLHSGMVPAMVRARRVVARFRGDVELVRRARYCAALV